MLPSLAGWKMRKPCAGDPCLLPGSVQLAARGGIFLTRDLSQAHLWCRILMNCHMLFKLVEHGLWEQGRFLSQIPACLCQVSSRSVRNKLASWLCDKEAEGEQNSTRNSVSWRTAKSQAVPTQGHYCLSPRYKDACMGREDRTCL